MMLSVPAAPTIVAIPTENCTDRLSPKLTVAAVPTALPLSLTVIPLPIPITPVSADPSPANSDAVTIPDEFIFPYEVAVRTPVMFTLPMTSSS